MFMPRVSHRGDSRDTHLELIVLRLSRVIYNVTNFDRSGLRMSRDFSNTVGERDKILYEILAAIIIKLAC